jgi:Domain of unknown function (DUF4279)
MKATEVKAYFRLVAPGSQSTLDARAVTETLGNQPTRLREAKARGSGVPGSGLTGAWIYQSPLGFDRTLSDHFSYLADLFHPRRDAVQGVCQRFLLTAEFDSVVYSYDCQGPEIVLRPELLRRIGELDAEIGIDYHSLSETEGG